MPNQSRQPTPTIALRQSEHRGLGVAADEPVTSPTYALLHQYQGRYPLYHFDLYRLNGAAELDELGFYEYVGGRGVLVVEWGERWFGSCAGKARGAATARFRWVVIESLSETGRRFTYEDLGV